MTSCDRSPAEPAWGVCNRPAGGGRYAHGAESQIEHFSIPEPNSGCWLWIGAMGVRGYGSVKRGGRKFRAHRVSFEDYCGPIPAGMFVCHKCDVPSCVNPAHLFLGTHADNMDDMNRKGRGRSRGLPGERNGRAVLTPSVVCAIRTDTGSLSVLARKYGVSDTTIGDIKARRTWGHV